MVNAKPFKGANVFMSRNLVPPEIFDAVHDALKNNGAQVFLCCDPSRNGPDDFHIISSPLHDKFQDLKAKGCNLLGPQCVLSCAKEKRSLPKRGFTCCLAMDGVKLLASGFEMDEKVKIGELVTAMGGVLHNKASPDVSFVIVKNVLAAKYKCALNILKKPIVTMSWLDQCWNEHRVVPQESYRVPPFTGLTICVTGILGGERKEIQKLILQNGGKYSAELKRNCTHLISNAPEGDKYKVAKLWGQIHIVTRKWLDQSIARRACLNEESYPVHDRPVSSHKITRDCLTSQHNQEKDIGKSQSAVYSWATDSNIPVVSSDEFLDRDLEATVSQHVSSSISYDPFVKEADAEAPPVQPSNEQNLDGAVANDSESDHDDLYLSECRILLVGFEASDMRKLVNMVRKGGGSRYMSFNDKLTHIVIGAPSEMEKKDVRSLAAFGVIKVVKTTWLEDCDREKKEVPVLRRHIAHDLVLPKDSGCFSKAVMGNVCINQGKSAAASIHQNLQADPMVDNVDSRVVMPSATEKNKEKSEIGVNDHVSLKAMGRSTQKNQLPVANIKKKDQQKMQYSTWVQNLKSSTVFCGRIFCFSSGFPEERRAEIVQWISQGGGEVINSQAKQKAHYIIECHGVTSRSADVHQSIYISSHWIRSCLEDGSLLDVDSHILYSPLPCHIPLPGFQSFRFCVSQYEDKDRILLRNLCFVLGAKLVEKLTKKVTHLLCKFSNGPKYEAACKWGVQPVASEWIFECVKQNGVVVVDQFLPKEVTAQDQEAGMCTVSQFPTQAAQMISEDIPTQFASQSQYLRNTQNQGLGSETANYGADSKLSTVYSKKARLLGDHGAYDKMLSDRDSEVHIYGMNATGDYMLKDVSEVSHAVPDVAAAIEDLLEQTSKMHDQKLTGTSGCDQNIFSSTCCTSAPGEDHSSPHTTVIGLSKHWLNRSGRTDDDGDASRERSAGIYDNFSETQTESQVVGYEEDLSGRQMLIDRVRTRSSLT